MATAQVVDGKAIVAYVDGKAVDSEGVEIPGAPKQPKDTPASEQPSIALTPEQRIGVAIADALAGRIPGAGAKVNDPDDDNDEGQAFTLEELPAHLASLTTVDDVKTARKGDKRKGAKALYEARIAELEG